MAGTFTSLRTALYGGEVPIVRDDVPSFLGVPVARTPEELRGFDVAVIGVPQGAAASPGRDPAEWSDYGRAPAFVRRQSLRYGGYLPEHDLDVFDRLKVVDYGDAELPADDPERAIENVARMVAEVIESGCRLVTIGGCVPTANYAVAKGIARATAGKVGTISLDAHGDCLDSLGGPAGSTRPGPGTWQRRLWEHCQNVDRARHVEIGMRGPRNVREMIETYRRNGALVYPMAAVSGRGIAAVCQDAFPHALEGTERAWFSLCMDVLDLGAIPDWGDEPFGLSVAEVLKAVHEAGKAGVDALAIQFVAPDSPGAARVACYAVIYLLAGWILGGRAGASR
ncbi:MAG: arginase family protein [Alphaproteobacteria bacterium]